MDEDMIVFFVIPIFRIGGRDVASICSGRQSCKFSWISYARQRPQKIRVEEAENGGVGADAERESENGDGGESWGFAEHAQAVAQILNQCPHTVSCLPA